MLENIISTSISDTTLAISTKVLATSQDDGMSPLLQLFTDPLRRQAYGCDSAGGQSLRSRASPSKTVVTGINDMFGGLDAPASRLGSVCSPMTMKLVLEKYCSVDC